MRSAARIFLVLMSATFALTVVLEAESWLSASVQEHVDRAISMSIDVQPDHLTAAAGENCRALVDAHSVSPFGLHIRSSD